jgi:hypothetical protein
MLAPRLNVTVVNYYIRLLGEDELLKNIRKDVSSDKFDNETAT